MGIVSNLYIKMADPGWTGSCNSSLHNRRFTSQARRMPRSSRLVPTPVRDIKTVSSISTVGPRHNEEPRDCQNLFARTRFRYIEVLFHLFCCYWGKENRSSYGGLCYIEVRYIEVPLYFHAKYIHTLS